MELAAAVSRMPGVELAGPIDTAAVTARRDEFVGHYDDGPQVSWVEKLPATFVRGQGRLAGGRIVRVTAPDGEAKAVEARRAVVLATAATRSSLISRGERQRRLLLPPHSRNLKFWLIQVATALRSSACPRPSTVRDG